MKTRFSEEQLRSLETTFAEEERPDPGTKLQLAKKLGLEPRQVAIWFQNRRARTKCKQMERELGALQANYDELALRFEELKKENQLLLLQVQRFKKMAGMTDGGDDSNSHKTAANWEHPEFLRQLSSEMVDAKYDVNRGGYLDDGSFDDGCSFQSHSSRCWDF